MTQTQEILTYLETGRKITPLQALKQFGCFRLGARVWDLKKLGHQIDSELIDVGDGKRVAIYWLRK